MVGSKLGYEVDGVEVPIVVSGPADPIFLPEEVCVRARKRIRERVMLFRHSQGVRFLVRVGQEEVPRWKLIWPQEYYPQTTPSSISTMGAEYCIGFISGPDHGTQAYSDSHVEGLGIELGGVVRNTPGE